MSLKKIIIVRLHGGLGNQLFCYSFGQYLKHEYNFDVYYDLKNGFRYDKKYKRKLNVNKIFSNIRSLENSNISFILKRGIFLKFVLKFELLQRLFNMQVIDDSDFKKNNLEDLSKTKNILFFSGYWQSYKYTDSIKSQLIKDNMLKCSIKKGSLAIHFRYFTDNDSEATLPLDYYRICLKQIFELKVDLNIHVFTDNYNNAVRDLKLLPIKNYIVHKGDLISDFSNILSCEYIISANSTLSWWACFLSNTEDCKKYAPDIVINSHLMHWGFTDLLPPRWNLIAL